MENQTPGPIDDLERTAPRPAPRARTHFGRTVALVVLLSVFWFMLSGRIGLQYAIFLITSVTIVLWFNPERPFPGLDPARGAGISGFLRAFGFLLRYLAWLVWNVIQANLQVARLILHPKLPIDPVLLAFETELESHFAQVIVANSITLTPGTVTIDLQDQAYLVHSLAPGSADAIASGTLQNMVGAIFGESPDPEPSVRRVRDLEDFLP